MTKQKVKKIDRRDIAKCPFCNSDNYERLNLDISDDSIFYDCNCLNCKKSFSETFALIEQEWED